MNAYETGSNRVVLAENFKSASAIYHQTVGEYPERMELMKAGLAGTIEQAMPGWLDSLPDCAYRLRNILYDGYGELLADYISSLEACLAEAKAAMAKFPTTVGVYEEVDGKWQSWSKPVPTVLPPADGWIEWPGGFSSPVSNGPLVEVRFRDGDGGVNRTATDWNWAHVFGGDDIIAYRIIEE